MILREVRWEEMTMPAFNVFFHAVDCSFEDFQCCRAVLIVLIAQIALG